jgi:hypothetical protein
MRLIEVDLPPISRFYVHHETVLSGSGDIAREPRYVTLSERLPRAPGSGFAEAQLSPISIEE